MHTQHLWSDALPPPQLERRRGRHWSGHHHRPGCNVRHFEQSNAKGGETYNMISKSLAFRTGIRSTAIEIILPTPANTVAVSLHTTGFDDSLNDL